MDIGLEAGMKEKSVVIESMGEEDTYALGRKLGESATPGEVFALVGNLGVGKTAFARGLAAGLGIEEAICSPTFTVVQVYEEGKLPLYHFDVYRIGDIEEMEEIGYMDYVYGNGVALIEWADRIREILPSSYREIHIEKDLQKGPSYRRITIARIET